MSTPDPVADGEAKRRWGHLATSEGAYHLPAILPSKTDSTGDLQGRSASSLQGSLPTVLLEAPGPHDGTNIHF